MGSTVLVTSIMFDISSSSLSDLQVRVALFAALHRRQLRDDGFADRYGERFRLDLEIVFWVLGLQGFSRQFRAVKGAEKLESSVAACRAQSRDQGARSVIGWVPGRVKQRSGCCRSHFSFLRYGL